MSGGHWNYENDYQLKDLLQNIARDLRDDYPQLASIFYILSATLPEITHEIDWDICGDSVIEDKDAFDKKSADKIRKLLKATKTVADLQKKINDAQKTIDGLLNDITKYNENH